MAAACPRAELPQTLTHRSRFLVYGKRMAGISMTLLLLAGLWAIFSSLRMPPFSVTTHEKLQ